MTIAWCYDAGAKQKKASQFRSILRKVANELGLPKGSYDIRFNPGGIAVWGECTLHADSVYVQMSAGMDLGVMVRYCNGRRDYTGGINRWVSWRNASIESIAAMARKAQTERY